jgi:hypothetical protein
MKIRITHEASGTVDGISLHYYHAGETYDVPAPLGEYLVATGHATVEMRQNQRSARRRPDDRRRGRGRTVRSPRI